MLNIKVDEDLPGIVAQILRSAGYAAVTVVEQGMGGSKDPVLFQAIQEESRLLVTADKGFANIRTYPPGTHGGILLLRPDEDGIGPLVELVRSVLGGGGLDRLRGMVAVATPQGLRVRKP